MNSAFPPDARWDEFLQSSLRRVNENVMQEIDRLERVKEVFGAAASITPGLALRLVRAQRRIGRMARAAPPALGGGPQSPRKLMLLRPLGEDHWPCPIVFEHAVPDGRAAPRIARYELTVEAAVDVRCHVTIDPASAAAPVFSAFLGRNASLITIQPEDLSLSALSRAVPGEWTLNLTAWSDDEVQLAGAVTSFLVTKKPSASDRYWQERAWLEEQRHRPQDALALLERIAHPLRRDLAVWEFLERQVEKLLEEKDRLTDHARVEPRRQAVAKLLDRWAPLRNLYRERIHKIGSKENEE